MEERAHHRVSPLALWPEARSAIALGMSYAPASDPLALAAHPELGRISAYAQGGDYHKTVKKALKALARFIVDQAPSELKVFVDTAPVMEKPLAQAAGIGWQGKHTNLVSREHGSWLFLGVILTSLELEPDAPADHGQHCGSCSRCLDACPTQAFVGPHRIDARRCISYLTIEHDGPIPDEFRRGDGQPHLRLRRLPGGVPVEPLRRRRGGQPRLPAAGRACRAAPRRSARARRCRRSGKCSPARRSSGSASTRMIRNCLIAAGNSGDARLARIGARAHLERPRPGDRRGGAMGAAISSAIRATAMQAA